MTGPMPMILTIVVIWTVLVIGILIGLSVHREATRRRRQRMEREQQEIEHERASLAGQRRLLGL